MNKNKKIIAIILVLHIFSLFILIQISELSMEPFVEDYVRTMNYGNPIIAVMPLFLGEFIHFFIMIIIALIAKVKKNIDKSIKKVMYMLPILTLILQVPISILVYRVL